MRLALPKRRPAQIGANVPPTKPLVVVIPAPEEVATDATVSIPVAPQVVLALPTLAPAPLAPTVVAGLATGPRVVVEEVLMRIGRSISR